MTPDNELQVSKIIRVFKWMGCLKLGQKGIWQKWAAIRLIHEQQSSGTMAMER
jgi:hypothetical protein